MQSNNKMKKIFKSLLLLSLCNILVDCTNYTNNNEGYLNIGIKFPEKGFTVKKVPDATKLIYVQIIDENPEVRPFESDISKPVNFNLTREYSKKLIGVIGGNKNIIAEAINAKNQVIGLARGKIHVIPKIHQSVTLEMFEVEPRPRGGGVPIATNIPVTPTPTPSITGPGTPVTSFPSSSNTNITVTPTPSSIASSTNTSNNGSSSNSGSSSGSSGGSIGGGSSGGNNNGGGGSTSNQPINLNVTIPTPVPTPSGITVQIN